VRIPNADRAIIDEAKLSEYLLSPSHPIGRFKAMFFATLGYTQENWQQLEADLRTRHLTQDAVPTVSNDHGQKYEILAALRCPGGKIAQVRSVWIVLHSEDSPRLITAYPGPEA
jgi:hypothetical protein